MSTFAVPGIAVLLLSISQAAGPAASRRRTPADDLVRFDDAALVRAWGGDSPLTGPAASGSRDPRPAPIRPDRYLVAEAGESRSAAWEGFVCRYVIDPSSPEPVAGSWKEARMPDQGELEGTFAFAHTIVSSASREIRMARLSGAETLFVNGEGFVGDLERRGFAGVPIELREGNNSVFVAGIRGGFELELWKPSTRILMAAWDVQYPFAERRSNTAPSAELRMPLLNASSDPAHAIHFHYGHAQCDDGYTIPVPGEWIDGGHIAPLCLGMRASFLFPETADEAVPEGCDDLLVPLCAYDATDPDAERRVLRLRGGSSASRDVQALSWSDAQVDDGSFLVYGTMAGSEDSASNLALARYFQQQVWYRSNVCPRVISDEEFLDPRAREGGAAPAILFGGARTNSVLGWRWSEAKPPGDEPSELKLSAPPRSSSQRLHPVFGVFSAPDARRMRMLYAIDPFYTLKNGVRLATYALDESGSGVLRRM